MAKRRWTRGIAIIGTEMYDSGIRDGIRGITTLLPEKSAHCPSRPALPSRSRPPLWSRESSFSGKIPLPYKSVPMMAIPQVACEHCPEVFHRAHLQGRQKRPLFAVRAMPVVDGEVLKRALICESLHKDVVGQERVDRLPTTHVAYPR